MVCDDRAVRQALESACHLHEGPVTVLELVWAWTADLWRDAFTDPQIDAMALPHNPSRADLARVRRRLADLHRQGSVVRTGHPAHWQPLESSNAALDDSDQSPDSHDGRPPSGTAVLMVPAEGGS